MDYLPFSFLKRVCPNLILYSFQQIIYLKYLRIEVDLVNVLFVVFGIYTLNGKVQPNLLQVKTSDFIEFLENEETPQDMTIVYSGSSGIIIIIIQVLVFRSNVLTVPSENYFTFF